MLDGVGSGSVSAVNEAWAITLLGAARANGAWRLSMRVHGAGMPDVVSVRVPVYPTHSWTATRVMEAVRRWARLPDDARPAVLNLLD